MNSQKNWRGVARWVLKYTSPLNISGKLQILQKYHHYGMVALGTTGMNGLTLMLLLANLADTKWWKKNWKMTETLAHRYLSESTQPELSNEYLHDRV